jgi:hypothetical protein
MCASACAHIPRSRLLQARIAQNVRGSMWRACPGLPRGRGGSPNIGPTTARRLAAGLMASKLDSERNENIPLSCAPALGAPRPSPRTLRWQALHRRVASIRVPACSGLSLGPTGARLAKARSLVRHPAVGLVVGDPNQNDAPRLVRAPTLRLLPAPPTAVPTAHWQSQVTG